LIVAGAVLVFAGGGCATGHDRADQTAGATMLTCRDAGAQGGPREQARSHYDLGQCHFINGAWAHAAIEFEAAYTAQPAPAFLYDIALSHQKAGHDSRAVDYYQLYLDTEPRARDRDSVERVIRGLQAAQRR
jgi:hypothetical protein